MSRRPANADFSKDARILEVLASGKYSVTADGRVFNNSHRNTGERRELHYFIDADGYKLVHLKGIGIARLHRVVALVFLDRPPDEMNVNHKSGDISDNSAANLEWGTPAETVAKATVRGRRHDQRGEGNGASRLTNGHVKKIRKLLNLKRFSQQKIASIFGVAQTTVSGIARRIRWGHV
jgi:hypothetical protein